MDTRHVRPTRKSHHDVGACAERYVPLYSVIVADAGIVFIFTHSLCADSAAVGNNHAVNTNVAQHKFNRKRNIMLQG